MPAVEINRLLTALEALTGEERLLLEHGMHAEVAALHEREKPLVARIAELLVQPGVAGSLDVETQNRAQRLFAAQRLQLDRLGQQIAATREQLDQVRQAQARAQKLRPAYGTEPAASLVSFTNEA